MVDIIINTKKHVIIIIIFSLKRRRIFFLKVINPNRQIRNIAELVKRFPNKKKSGKRKNRKFKIL